MNCLENKLKDFYAEHLDLFLENYFDIELSLWQKILLRNISLKKNIRRNIK